MLVGGVLVVDDTSMTFQASPAMTLQCVSGSEAVRQASVFLDVYQPPIITGATTVNEGGTLFLTCDSTNSNREPLAQWFDKDGQMVSSSGILNIPNIMRSQAGSYTSPPNLDNSTSTTVTFLPRILVQVTVLRQKLSLAQASCHRELSMLHQDLFVSVHQPPIITGETTVNEGDTLSLNCDSSNSNQQPSVQWFRDRLNRVLSSVGELTIASIVRCQAGTYTCVTAPPNPEDSTSTSVEVVVIFLSQSVDDCTATVQIVGTTSAPNQIDIPLGTVCVECVVNGAVVAATFQIGNSPIHKPGNGGVLVVDDTSMTFEASPSLILRCFSGSDVRQTSVFLDVYLPPIITGVTTINEGGMLSLIVTAQTPTRTLCTVVRRKMADWSSSGVLKSPTL
ncbi:hypothetical protein GBAR_LOCUS24383 [Geodia barretti]|uniref:Ig-like domain-containing protein n=1 Tax=Geodia barretti TaxID=519541 RepID=A0AA35TAC4_GEOBA|nr:hypothetical protein GBAR_LOCUS24383 [Geodia barretti]